MYRYIIFLSFAARSSIYLYLYHFPCIVKPLPFIVFNQGKAERYNFLVSGFLSLAILKYFGLCVSEMSALDLNAHNEKLGILPLRPPLTELGSMTNGWNWLVSF